MNKQSNIFVVGHEGEIGKAFVERLKGLGYESIITAAEDYLDLTNLQEVDAFFTLHDIDTVIFALEPKDRFYNVDLYRTYLTIQTNVIDAAYRYGAFDLLYIGDMNMYPSIVPQPIEERYLLSNYFDFQKEAYGLVKVLGLKMCQAYNEQYGTNFLSVIPSELYGHSSQDRISKLINMLASNHATIEEDSSPLQLLHIHDFIDSSLLLLREKTERRLYNIGPHRGISIHEVMDFLKEQLRYDGQVEWIKEKETSTRKMLSTKQMRENGVGICRTITEGIYQMIEESYRMIK